MMSRGRTGAKTRERKEKPSPQRQASALQAAEAPIPIAPGTPEFEGQYRVELPSYEGPLDLLLHLIQQHELDILDIPVSFITEKYLAYISTMRSLQIDLASEYLLMAATLIHIKSKMLLPVVPKGQEEDGLPGEEEDPRAELVRRLLEYQKYKAAAGELGGRSSLGRDVFPRGAAEPVPEEPATFAPLGVFALLEAFDKILKRTNVRIDHEVMFDRISITDRIVELTERLGGRKSMGFEQLITSGGSAPPTRFDVVITFLALLEMARMRLVRVYQSGVLEPLHIELLGEGAAEGDELYPTSDLSEALPEARARDAEDADEEGEAPRFFDSEEALGDDDELEGTAEEAELTDGDEPRGDTDLVDEESDR